MLRYCTERGGPTLYIYTHQVDRVARSTVDDLRSAIDIAGIATDRVRELVPGKGRVCASGSKVTFISIRLTA